MTTTNDTLPAALRGKYELTRPLNGGPVFALPAYGFAQIDFSALTEREAELLVRKGWPLLRRVAVAPARIAKRATPKEPEPDTAETTSDE